MCACVRACATPCPPSNSYLSILEEKHRAATKMKNNAANIDSLKIYISKCMCIDIALSRLFNDDCLDAAVIMHFVASFNVVH